MASVDNPMTEQMLDVALVGQGMQHLGTSSAKVIPNMMWKMFNVQMLHPALIR